MKKPLAFILALCALLARPLAAGEAPPDLIVLIVVDGLPVRHLTDHADQFSEGGFKLLLHQGARLNQARYGFANTCTASGHATLLTGAQPNRHGIISNIWFDRRLGREVYSVEDAAHVYLDEPMGKRRGSSPKNLKVPTLGDALHEQTQGRPRVFAVSLKDRAAILMAGKTGMAYFYSSFTGRFITSTYYQADYPAWLSAYHARNTQDRWLGKTWGPSRPAGIYPSPAKTKRYSVDPGIGKKFPHRLTGSNIPDQKYYSRLSKTPFANEYLLDFIKELVQKENLGKTPGAPDLLAVSFSTHDAVNHFFGPESAEALDHLLRLDEVIKNLIEFVSENNGLERTLFVLTSDHGFSDSPEYARSKGFEAGRLDPQKIMAALNRRLSEKYGPARYAVYWSAPTFYLDHELITKKGLKSSDIEKESTAFLLTYPGIAQVFTRRELDNPYLISDGLQKKVWRSWLFETRGDLYLVPKERYYLMDEPREFAANHGTPYDDDARVPLIFFGRRVKTGDFEIPADMTDLAPTLAEILGIKAPQGSEGKVLREILN